MKRRVLVGTLGRRSWGAYIGQGYRSPETVGRIEATGRVDASGTIPLTRSFRTWGDALPRIRGRNWCVYRDRLLIDGAPDVAFSGGILDGRTAPELWGWDGESAVVESGALSGLDRAWTRSWTLPPPAGLLQWSRDEYAMDLLLFGRWLWRSDPFVFTVRDTAARDLSDWVDGYPSPARERLRELLRDKLVPKDVAVSLPGGPFFVATCYSRGADGLLEPCDGGIWTDADGDIWASGGWDAGKALVVPTAFGADGAVLGASVVNDRRLSMSQESAWLICPIPGGSAAYRARDGDALGNLTPVDGTIVWATDHRFDISGPEGYSGGSRTKSGMPPILKWDRTVKETCVSLFGETADAMGNPVPWQRTQWNGVSALLDWIAPLCDPEEMLGTYVASRPPKSSGLLLTDLATLRRFVAPSEDGTFDIHFENGGAATLSTAGKDRKRYASSIVMKGTNDAPVEHPGIACAPWRGRSCGTLEIGWWRWPDLGIMGAEPAPEHLGDGNPVNDYTYDGVNIQYPRRGMAVTSDGYVYCTADRFTDSGNSFAIVTHAVENGEWKSTCALVPNPNGLNLVAPMGAGNYSIHHLPGADWSIFHAPVGEIRRTKVWSSMDWSWLLGIGGGLLAPMWASMTAYENAMKEQLGGLWLVDVHPHHTIAVGDARFESVETVVADSSGDDYVFVGWRADSAEAVFVRFKKGGGMAGSLPAHDFVRIGKNGMRSAEPTSYEAAIAGGLVRSWFLPRFVDYDAAVAVDPLVAAMWGDAYYSYSSGARPLDVIPGSILADIDERLRAWRAKIEASTGHATAVGQVSDNAILTSAAVDWISPVADLKGTEHHVLLRDLRGTWISVEMGRNVPTPYFGEASRGPEFVSIGRRNGEIFAIFGEGEMNYGWMDFDEFLFKNLGIGYLWPNWTLNKWYARFHAISVSEDAVELARLNDFLKG